VKTCGQEHGCSLTLPPGASHFGLDACVAALRDALERASTCSECGEPVAIVLHPGCAPGLVAKRATSHGVKHVEKKIGEAISDFLTGKKTKPEDDESHPRRPRRGGTHFDP
jgi:hypothetical protein